MACWSARLVKKKSSEDLYRLTSFPPIDWQSELCYTVGYLNAWIGTIVEITGYVEQLRFLEKMDPEDALSILRDLSKNFGASNYLSYKLAYVRSAFPLTASQLKVVAEIEREIGHRNSLGMHFSALENISPKISLFVVAQRRVSGLVAKVTGDFRRSLALSNFIPTPLSCDDLAAFLLRATESSLIDTVYAIITILNIREISPSVQREIYSRLDPTLTAIMKHFADFTETYDKDGLVTEYYCEQDSENECSLNLYRVASAFLERPRLAQFRNKLDRVFGARLLAEIIGDESRKQAAPFDNKALLLAANDTPVE